MLYSKCLCSQSSIGFWLHLHLCCLLDYQWSREKLISRDKTDRKTILRLGVSIRREIIAPLVHLRIYTHSKILDALNIDITGALFILS